MRAAIMYAPRDMRIGEWEAPRPKPGEVLVAVGAAGICAGDMYHYLGKNPYAGYPQICGHEIAGIVTELGDGITQPAPGSRVVVDPFVGCGTCYPCRVGKPNCCTSLQIIGVHTPGGYGQFLTAPATNVHPIPSGLSLALASAAEPVAIAVHACRRADAAADEYVLVLGCGPIGLGVIEVAKARGTRVVAVANRESRMEMARQLGAEALIANDQLLAAVLEQTKGEGAAVVIEATGRPEVMEQTVDLVAAGGRIVILGLVKQGIGVTFAGLDLTRKEVTLLGSRASTGCFPEAIQLIADGIVTYPTTLTSEFSLWEAPRVFAQLADKRDSVLKGILIQEPSV